MTAQMDKIEGVEKDLSSAKKKRRPSKSRERHSWDVAGTGELPAAASYGELHHVMQTYLGREKPFEKRGGGEKTGKAGAKNGRRSPPLIQSIPACAKLPWLTKIVPEPREKTGDIGGTKKEIAPVSS